MKQLIDEEMNQGRPQALHAFSCLCYRHFGLWRFKTVEGGRPSSSLESFHTERCRDLRGIKCVTMQSCPAIIYDEAAGATKGGGEVTDR